MIAPPWGYTGTVWAYFEVFDFHFVLSILYIVHVWVTLVIELMYQIWLPSCIQAVSLY